MFFEPRHIFALFAFIIGLNLITPIDLSVMVSDHCVMSALMDWDGEGENEEEPESKTEEDIEIDDLIVDSSLMSNADDLFAKLKLGISLKHNIKSYTDVETPPPDMI